MDRVNLFRIGYTHTVLDPQLVGDLYFPYYRVYKTKVFNLLEGRIEVVPSLGLVERQNEIRSHW